MQVKVTAAEDIEKLRRAQDDLNEEYRDIVEGLAGDGGARGAFLAEWLAAIHAWEGGRRAEEQLTKLAELARKRGAGAGG